MRITRVQGKKRKRSGEDGVCDNFGVQGGNRDIVELIDLKLAERDKY